MQVHVGSPGFSRDSVHRAQPGALRPPLPEMVGKKGAEGSQSRITGRYLSLSLRIQELGPTTQCGTKTDRGMIWLILGFFLQAWTCLLFFALFEYKPAWVQHEGPSLVILFYIGHRSAYSIRWIRPTQQCVHKVCTKSAPICAGRVRGIVAKVCILQNNCHSPAFCSHICTFRCHSKLDR